MWGVPGDFWRPDIRMGAGEIAPHITLFIRNNPLIRFESGGRRRPGGPS